jgi:hypothetical protein
VTPVENREQLVALLTEAAEIEHCLMCSYLYANFSLKRAGDGLEPGQQAAVDRWRASMYTVAKDEMLHLALVSNMLVAVGARPHYRRPNFPVDPGRFPAEVVVRLRRFDRATLDHFIYL